MIKEIPSVDKFNTLDFDEKAWHVWHHATFLIVRQNNKYRVNLYYLNGYYIQLWYNVKKNRIEKIAATPSSAVINPYLKLIHLEDISTI
ncbi:MAG: hypothetical protein ABI772_03025 [Bacteroidota bacterium]